tara:strand:- start:82012 stop:82128 length:117 start_codon:yes stop_codon:yes gene_type:complete
MNEDIDQSRETCSGLSWALANRVPDGRAKAILNRFKTG